MKDKLIYSRDIIRKSISGKFADKKSKIEGRRLTAIKNIEKSTLILMMMMMMTKKVNNQCNKEDHQYHI